MKCRICGREGALVRECEIQVARITLRAHVDCEGHSEYRHVSSDDVEDAAKARKSHEPVS